MNYDILLCGVGGQGIISLAAIITNCAASAKLNVKQVEVHGMAQRGGTVKSHIRMSDEPIASNQIPAGTADMLLSTEPLEALRYVHYLAMQTGICLSALSPVDDIPGYPPFEALRGELQKLPRLRLIDAQGCAEAAGSRHMINIVMLGAASVYLPIGVDTLKLCIAEKFGGRGEKFVRMNYAAFDSGRAACLRNE